MRNYIIKYNGKVYEINCKSLQVAVEEFRKKYPNEVIDKIWAITACRGASVTLYEKETAINIL